MIDQWFTKTLNDVEQLTCITSITLTIAVVVVIIIIIIITIVTVLPHLHRCLVLQQWGIMQVKTEVNKTHLSTVNTIDRSVH